MEKTMIAPTLIIGLGGIGSKIVARVAQEASESQKQSISFVVFDTDINELRSIRKINPDIRTVQTSTSLTVGEYLNIDQHAREEWFPVNRILNRKSLTEGAGQVRAISRLAFDTAIRANNVEDLHHAIEDLYKLSGDAVEQALRVIIVSSLAGGTGSGLILPVSMYVKNYLKKRFQRSANIMRGFFILPEVFYGVIAGQAERNNLKCNAYATVRELDAFLMKGDGTLPERYKELVFEAPRPGSKEYDEYDVMPFDFCFLFDAQNVSGKKLNSFEEYLDHAAKSIYAQSIGPMNTRSNSSEDNVIRELAKFGGRNRYCGAGSSMLKYPMQDVKQYVAYNWAKESVSDTWLSFDRDYIKQRREYENMRAKGIPGKEPKPSENYIENVNGKKDKESEFATAIYNSAYVIEDTAFAKSYGVWERYVSALRDFVTKEVPDSMSELVMKHRSVSAVIGSLGSEDNDWGQYVTAYQEIMSYKAAVKNSVETKARTLSYQLFKSDESELSDTQDYRLEKHLKNQDGYIHPNAIRYVLYQTESELRLELDKFMKAINDKTTYIENFEKSKFDDPKTEDQDGSVELLNNRKSGGFRKKPTAEQEELQGDYINLLNKIKETLSERMYIIVLEDAMKYVNSLSRSFEAFYTSLGASVGSIDKSIKSIENKYENTSGHAVRYVCVSKKYLNLFKETMPYTGSSITLPGDLSRTIYRKVREHSMLGTVEANSNGNFFSNLFNKDIMGYFADKVMEIHGPSIDVDIITALETEAEFEGKFDDDKLEYVKSTISSTRILSEPFIETPLGEQRNPITSCAYNTGLDIEDNPARHDLVNVELKSFGGIADGNVEKNMIIFYKAIYGLKAKDLSKFAPADPSTGRSAGEYFKAYYELVNQITPDLERNKVITPHIDRNWHVISRLPDIDEDNQVKIENGNFMALFYGTILHKISYVYVSPEQSIYRVSIGDESVDILVSNHTACDKFYEVLDGLTINPYITKHILDYVEEELSKEREDKVPFENSAFRKGLNELVFPELSPSIKSIFDFPTALKYSTPTSLFIEEEGLDFLRNILENVYQYLSDVTPENELNAAYGQLIREQYLIFKLNLNEYEKDNSSILGSFVDSMLQVMINRLRTLGLKELAKEIEKDRESFNTTKRLNHTKS